MYTSSAVVSIEVQTLGEEAKLFFEVKEELIKGCLPVPVKLWDKNGCPELLGGILGGSPEDFCRHSLVKFNPGNYDAVSICHVVL